MKENPLNHYYIDFDNTLCNTIFNPITGKYDMGAPLEGMVDAVNNCSETRKIVVFTARPFSEWEEVRKWLAKAKVNYNGITNIKEPAIAYVDDRAMKPDEFIDKFKSKPRKPYTEDEFKRDLKDAEISAQYDSNGERL